MNAKDIIKDMKVIPEINAAEEVRRRVDFIKQSVINSGTRALVLGISGGVDSTACGRLAQKAINELNEEFDGGYEFIAVRLPYGVQKDEDDAQEAISFIDPSRIVTVNIASGANSINDAVISALWESGVEGKSDYEKDFAKGNVKARTRMAVQYQIAGLMGGLVLGTDHSAENVMGFYTKYGDGACDIAPLFGLNKRQVRQIVGCLGGPKNLVEKAPTADLEDLNPGLEDEDALGLRYDEIDDFLEGKEVSPEVEAKVIDIYTKTQHKRQPIPTVYD